ncbi:MAG: hypothetical protein WCT53_05490 [Candidatus Gracilibacteria bacterium]|jgi:hypothetical protein
MDLQSALSDRGLVKPQTVEVPETWKRCEIHGVDVQRLPTSLEHDLSENSGVRLHHYGVTAVTLVIEPSKDTTATPTFSRTLQSILTAYPGCEILWF